MERLTTRRLLLRAFESEDLQSLYAYCSELDGRRVQKEEVVAEALRQLSLLGDAGETAMIGDRRFDIEGAQAHRLTGIGVAYGYALPGELEEAGADFVVQDVAELQKLLLGKE